MTPVSLAPARLRWLLPMLPLLLLLLAPEAGTADVIGFSVARGQTFAQLPLPGMEPVLDAQGYRWRAGVRAAETGSVLAAAVVVPGGGEQTLGMQGAEWSSEVGFATAAAREAAFADGSYRFQIQGRADGLRSTTLALSAGPSPRLARVVEPEALLSVSGRTDLTVGWELVGDGVEPTSVRVRIVNLMGAVVYESPDPGQAGALAGTATEAVIPQAAWLGSGVPAGETGLFQLQLTTFRTGSTETAAYPGAVGYSATYRTTAISVMVTDVPACGDVEHFEVLLGRLWRQSGPEDLGPTETGGHVFRAGARECLGRGIVAARLTPPGGTAVNLPATGGGSFGFEDTADTASALAARHPSGAYTFEIEGRQAGIHTAALSLRGGEWVPPRVANWDALQSPDYSQAVEIRLVPDAGRGSEEDLQLQVVDGGGNVVHETSGWWLAEARIPGDTVVLTVPRGVLKLDRLYEGRLRRLRRDHLDTASLPNASGLAGTFVETRFPIGSRSPQVLAMTFGILDPAVLPELTLGTSVNYQFATRAGVYPVSWELTGGALPDGIQLDPVSGDLLGIPARTGAFTFGLRARDAGTNVATGTFAVSVTGHVAPLAVVTGGLPDGTGELRYCGVLSASGGVGPYVWRLDPGAGRLPRGLALDPEGGLITGIPEESGTFPVRVVAIDRAGRTSEAGLNLVVPPFEPTPPLVVAGYRRFDGRQSLRLVGAPEGSYLVEASEDLVSWQPVASTNQAPVADWEFADPAGAERRFFRARLGAIRPELKSLDVHARLDAGRTVTAVMSEADFVLRLTNHLGIVFELALPAGAVWEPTEIRMTAVTEVPDLPMSGGFLAGVSLEPEGLLLHRAGTLTLRFPGEVPAEATAFSAQELGLDFHRVGQSRGGASIAIPVPHFTLFGMGTDAQKAVAAEWGCSLEGGVSEMIEAVAQQPKPAYHPVLVFALTIWFDVDRGVRPTLLKALSDERQVLNAWRELKAWTDLVARTAVDPRLAAAGADRLPMEMAGRAQAGRELLGKAFLNAFKEVEARCVKNKSVVDAFRLRAEIELAREAVNDGLCQPVFDWAQLERRLADLLRCEFVFRSTAIVNGSEAFSSVIAQTSEGSGQRGVLLWDPGTGLWTGNARLGLGSWTYSDNSGTTTRSSAVERGGVSARNIKIGWKAQNRRVTDASGCVQLETTLTRGELSFEFNPHGDFDLTLVPKKGPTNNTGEDLFWRDPFALAMNSYQSDSGFRLAGGWEWTEAGERFARWHKTLGEGKVSVSTTIDLYYAPLR